VTAGQRTQVTVPGQRTSLKERASVKRGFGLQFRTDEAVCRAWLTDLVCPFSALLPIPCAREAWVKDRASGPAAFGGAAGVLDAGDRAPMIRAGKGHRAGWGLCGCWRPHGRLAAGQPRRAAYIPSRVPGMPAGCIGRLRGWAGGVNHAGARAAGPAVPVPGGGSTLRDLAPGRGPGPGHAACPGRLARRMCPSCMP
jgi:hypothetical protein